MALAVFSHWAFPACGKLLTNWETALERSCILIESLLLNFLFLLFPVVIFLIFFENRLHTYNKYILILLTAITMVLCMVFPIRLKIGFIFDLRYIPFICIALYGDTNIPFHFILS